MTPVNKSYAYAPSLAASGDTGGLRIVDVTDPQAPIVRSFYPCDTNQLDVQVLERGERSYVLLGIDYPRSRPQQSQCFAALGDPRFYANGRIQIVDLQDVTRPVMVAEVDLPPGGSSHDVTFNAAGTRAYSAALTQTVVLDTTEPATPRWISVIEDPSTNLHHQADPYSVGGRDYLVITDELAGAAGNGFCPGGGLHVYDITVEAAPVKTSFFVVPQVDTFIDTRRLHRCTAHVLRIYPDQMLMTIAWYSAGTWVVDVSDPSAFEAIGYADASGTDGRRSGTWSAKLHRDHIYANDTSRGLDVFRPSPGRALVPTRLKVAGVEQGEAQTVRFDMTQPAGRPLFCFDRPQYQ